MKKLLRKCKCGEIKIYESAEKGCVDVIESCGMLDRLTTIRKKDIPENTPCSNCDTLVEVVHE